jgi:NAD(P)H-flavin reductase/hemoglobin-like flavoprotein
LSIASADATILDVAIALDSGHPGQAPAGNRPGRPGPAGRTAPPPPGPPPPPLPGVASKVPVQRRQQPAGPESPAGPQSPARTAANPGAGGPAAPPGHALLKESFAAAGPTAGQAISYFYSLLFTAHPELRCMFPPAMDGQREKLHAALATCVWSMDDPQALAEHLGQLARDHRKYGVKEKHYVAFTKTLATAMRLVSGPAWTAEMAAAWESAVGHIGSVMVRAARQAASEPAWWVAEVIRHERRCPDLAVLTLRPGQPFPFQAGQYLSVQVTRWPRVWRKYSIGNAPRRDGTLDLHVRAIPGGQVSTALVQQTAVGDSVLLGPAQGSMVADPASPRDMLCVAGGTGLAPIKAIIEGLAAQPAPAGRTIRLFVGARQRPDLYDLPDLVQLQAACRGLEVITALSDDPDASGVHGLLPDVVRMHATWRDRDVFICGPPEMVRGTLRVLAHRASGEHVHLDPAAGDRARLPS